MRFQLARQVTYLFPHPSKYTEHFASDTNEVYIQLAESPTMDATVNAVTTWVSNHPYQTAMHAANVVILCTPAAITVPVFSALGFSAAGPAAGIASVCFQWIDKADASQAQQQVARWATSASYLLVASMQQCKALPWVAMEQASLLAQPKQVLWLLRRWRGSLDGQAEEVVDRLKALWRLRVWSYFGTGTMLTLWVE